MGGKEEEEEVLALINDPNSLTHCMLVQKELSIGYCTLDFFLPTFSVGSFN